MHVRTRMCRMKKVPSHAYVRITGPAAGRPAERLSPGLFRNYTPRYLLEKRSLVAFPIRNGHQKAPRGAMLVKMAGFPYAKRVSWTWVGREWDFRRITSRAPWYFKRNFLGWGIFQLTNEISWRWSWRKDWFSKVQYFSSSSSKIFYLSGSTD